MSIASWICLLVVVVQQLMMNRGLALNIKEDGFNRIVEGKFAEPNQFPWAAAIYRNGFDYKKMKPTPNNHSFTCGGTIINSNFILTAAHCVFETDLRIGKSIYKYQPSDFRVVVGSSDIAGDSLEKLEVQTILVYEKYDNESSQNDIALLKLRQPLILSNTTQAMKLQRDLIVNNGQIATVAGWGYTCQPNSTLAHLRFASVRIMPFKYCADGKITEPIIEETAFCVGPDKHTAPGDSGSGMWMKKNDENYLIGIDSMGSSCDAKQPSLHTNVLYFYDWIIENMNKL